MTKPLIEAAARLLKDSLWKGEAPLVIVDAPTAYGKTTQSGRLYGAVRRYASSYIHVLPLRALVEEAFRSAVSGPGAKVLSEALRVPGEGLGDIVGYQAMALSLGGKSPYFMKEVIFTTLTSYILNLYRVPVAEGRQRYRHFEVPRAYILNALNVFDEAHLYGGETPFIIGLRALSFYKALAVIESATMPEKAVKELCSEWGEGEGRSCYWVRLDTGDGPRGDAVLVKDDEFVERACNIRWRTSVEDVSGPECLANLVAKRRGKVMVVLNTPEEAARAYLSLKDDPRLKGVPIFLIHGRMLPSERERSLECFRRSEEAVLIATQVVEAGVNIGVDTVITAAAAPSSLIQRAGRAARGGEKKGEVVVVRGLSTGPYSRDVVERAVNIMQECGEGMGWRCPRSPCLTALVNAEEFRVGAYSYELTRLVTDSLAGTESLIERLIGRGEGVCNVFGPEHVIAPLQIPVGDGYEELPVSVSYIIRAVKRGLSIDVVVEDGNGSIPLENIISRYRQNTACREIMRIILKEKAVLRLPKGAYREGLGLVVLYP